jgi:hypothetical protein
MPSYDLPNELTLLLLDIYIAELPGAWGPRFVVLEKQLPGDRKGSFQDLFDPGQPVRI